MTNKSNMEITIEELKKIHGEYMVAKAETTISGEYYKNEDEWKHKFFKPLATTLLSKLNRLDRAAIDNIITEIWDNEIVPLWEGIATATEEIQIQKALDKIIDQILTLIPEEGEVIAEGLMALSEYRELIINNERISMFNLFNKLTGKKGRLIFIEDKK